MFPFVLPWDDASPSVTNVSSLLEKPAGAQGFVVAKEGHLFEGISRFRIFGVNTAFGANFPTHADAEKVAARMAKFGINCVRFHHMDNQAAPGGIWSADMKSLDPGQLDKLDYFIAQLKKNGIYADLNLHVSRNYPGMPKWEGMPGFFKGVDNFYPPMIAMQHDYARMLLTHVNPYSNTAYVDEPAVAIIEINNENGLIGEWWRGSLDGMNDEYQVELESRWNRWLQMKYPTQAALEKAWDAGQEPLLGAEILSGSDFENGARQPWSLEQHGSAKASAVRDGSALRVSVSETDGSGWHVQLSQPGIAFSKEKHYTVTFRARAAAPRQIEVVASQTHSPWSQLWSTNVQLTPEWKEFRFTFQPSADEEKGRIVFSNLATESGDCWLSDASLRIGGVPGLREGEKLGTVPVFKKSEFGMRTAVAQRDWIAFLSDTESGYWTAMRQFLKEDLKAKSLIVGSATGFSPPTIQAKMDVVDGHAYWQHPHFPHKPWDPVDWTVNNIPMAGVPGGGTLPDLAQHRVAGKPYICTEYNEAAPNTHSSEAFLLLSAYAALQDWDGVFVFAYSHRHNDWDSRRICSFFDLDQHPAKLATLPAAVSMFLRGDVAGAEKGMTLPVSRDGALDACLHSGPWWGMEAFGMGNMLPLQSRVQMDLNGGTGAAQVPQPAQAGNPSTETVTLSDTGELAWDAGKQRFTMNTPRNKALIGKVTGESVRLGDVTIFPALNMQNWAAITVTDMKDSGDGHDFLITATGCAENTGMRWTSPLMNSVGSDWGTAPSLVEGIPAKITLPVGPPGLNGIAIKAWALDARGQRKTEIEIARQEREVDIEIGPQYRTLWYEVEMSENR